MMLNRRVFRLIAPLLALLSQLAGCDTREPQPESLSIAALKGQYRGFPMEISSPLPIAGVVVSSDRHGEHHHRLVLQDNTGGVEVWIERDELFKEYWVGDSLEVRTTGLTLGNYGGQVVVGDEPRTEGYEVGEIEWPHWQKIARHAGVATEVVARRVRIADLAPSDISTLVIIEEVRCVEAGLTWAEEGVSHTRHLVDATNPTDTLALRASGYSHFWHQRIPTGTWAVEGIVGYFGGDYQLVISSADALFLPTW